MFENSGHQITTAASEGLNSRIEAIRTAARGYRNRQHVKAAIHFRCGGLDLFPLTQSIPR